MAARAMRALQANEACAQSHPLGLSTVCSITPSALERTSKGQIFTFSPFSPFQPQFECKDPQHHKTLKQTKTLEIN
jgi:hypothetical protein